MAWSMKGQMIETCSCNMFCPCWFGVQELMIMDEGWCAIAIAFRVVEGNSDGLSLGGRTVVFALDFPGPTLFDGNGTARLFVDGGADADQQRELEAIFQGNKGGPMANLAALVATRLPTTPARIDVREDGDSVTVAVEGVGEVRSQRLRDGEGNTFTLHGGGFVAGLGLDAAELAPSATEWVDPDMPRQFQTKSGARGNFTWRG